MNVRGFDVLIAAFIGLAATIGVALLPDTFWRVRGRAESRVADTALAAIAAAYVILGAIPLVRHQPFLYNSFPMSAAIGVIAIAGAAAVLMLRFLL
jgi:multisubunit Na+/H+ antiporter MnhG subunit